MPTGAQPAVPAHDRLSTPERRVALLLAHGNGVGEIADTMCLSAKTVSTYRGRALEKLGLGNNAELTRYCLAQGLNGMLKKGSRALYLSTRDGAIPALSSAARHPGTSP